jgi:hypothetical protein
VVGIVNVAVLAPLATVTDAGTEAAPLLTDRLTTSPSSGAMPDSCTVPVADVPPRTAAGVTVIPVRTGCCTDKVAVFVTVPCFAVTVTEVVVATAMVVATKVVVLAPPGTVTDAGTVTDGSLDESKITVPPETDVESKVMVPVTEVPPLTCVGANVRLVSVAGLIVRVAVTVFPQMALIVAVTVEATA